MLFLVDEEEKSKFYIEHTQYDSIHHIFKC